MSNLTTAIERQLDHIESECDGIYGDYTPKVDACCDSIKDSAEAIRQDLKGLSLTVNELSNDVSVLETKLKCAEEQIDGMPEYYFEPMNETSFKSMAGNIQVCSDNLVDGSLLAHFQLLAENIRPSDLEDHLKAIWQHYPKLRERLVV